MKNKLKRIRGTSELYIEAFGKGVYDGVIREAIATGIYLIEGNSLNALLFLKNLIDNYNKMTVSLPNIAISTLGFLQEHNLGKGMASVSPYIREDARKYFKKNYPDIYNIGESIENEIYKMSRIFHKSLMKNEEDILPKRILIQINKKEIMLQNMFSVYTVREYKAKKLNPFFDDSKLPVSEINLCTDKFCFNELDDVIDIMKNGVWKSADDPEHIICLEDLSYHYIDKTTWLTKVQE